MDRVRAEVAVRQLLNRTMDAWNTRSPEAYVRCLAPRVSVVTPSGKHLIGRPAVQAQYEEALAATPGSTVSIEAVTLTHQAPGSVFAVVQGRLRLPGEKEPESWISTSIAVCTPDDEWRLVSVHNTLLPPPHPPRHWYTVLRPLPAGSPPEATGL